MYNSTLSIPWGTGLCKENIRGGELSCSLDTKEVLSKLHARICHMGRVPSSPWLGLDSPQLVLGYPPFWIGAPLHSWDWGTSLAETGVPHQLGLGYSPENFFYRYKQINPLKCSQYTSTYIHMCPAGDMPLAFTQGDFLVFLKLLLYCTIYYWPLCWIRKSLCKQ